MPTVMRKVGARVALDGEAEYKRAVSELQKGNAVLGSEMRKLQAEYKGNTESTEFLTKKGELLERQLLQQKDKVQTLRDALANAAKQYGESSTETQEWQIKLNAAESAQYNLEAAIRENNQALQGEEEVMQGLGDTVGDLAKKMGVKIPDGAKKALNGMQNLSAGTVAAMSAAATGVMALWKTVTKLHQLTLSAASEIDDIITKSMTTGLATKTLQELEYAAPLIDVSIDTISGSLTKLTRNISSSADEINKYHLNVEKAIKEGTDFPGKISETAQAFQRLGIELEDEHENYRNAEDVFYDIIDALGEIPNQTDRDSVAMQLLGKSAQDLNPLILQGSGALRELAEQAEATGYVLDESQTKKLGEVDDAYQELQLQIDKTKKQLAAEFAPTSKEVMEDFARFVGNAGDMLTRSGLVSGVGELVQYAGALLQPLGALLGLAPELTSGLQPLYIVLHAIAGVFAWIADAGNATVGLLTGFTASGRTRLNTALGLNAKYGMYSNLQQWNGTAAQYEEWRGSAASGYASQNYGFDKDTGRYYDRDTGNYIYGYNASGNDNWRGGLTWVGENGPERAWLPRGTQILSAQESRGFGGDVFNITIPASDVKEFCDIVEIARSARVRARMR